MSVRQSSVAWGLCALSLVGLACAPAVAWASRSELDESPVEVLVTVVGFAGFPVVGALLVTKVPGNRYGWVWTLLGSLTGLAFGLISLGTAAAVPEWVVALAGLEAYLLFSGLAVPLFLLFPTGRVPSPRWRWLLRATVVLTPLTCLTAPLGTWPPDVGPPNPWALPGGAGTGLWSAVTVVTWCLGVAVLLATVSVVPRFRAAGPVERRQLEWFLLAAAVNAVTVLLTLTPWYPTGVLATVVDAIAFTLLPLAVGIAVLRYRLYEIDRIVSRTVSYAVLTAVLVAVYVVVVTALRQVLAPVTGSSELAVAASTLAVAALFRPLRRRVQAGVDRRFDRARYDAARTVEAYARRLRTQVDLEAVVAGLQDTVTATVGPERLTLWLRGEAPSPGAGR